MQTLSWYINRLQGMSAREVLWRTRSAARDVLDRYRIAAHNYPTADTFPGINTDKGFHPGFRVTDLEPGAWAAAGASEYEKRWLVRLRDQADRLVEHRFSFFDLEDRFLGDPIDWHRDHGSGRPAPRIYSQAIDYRDFGVTGDCKLVWEPNRHHQLVVLGRAFWASGERPYAEAVAEQFRSWLDENPFGIGMNWRSPLELGIRLINWVWALDLIRDTDVIPADLERRMLHSAYLHCWEISRKYSRGSSANNHLIGEAAGVFVAASYFTEMPGSQRWREESRAIICEETLRQSYPDGCTREQALGYQLFVLQFLLICGVVARWRGEDFPAAYWQRLEKMLEFLAHLQSGGRLPKFGDADDGYVLDLGGDGGEARQLLAIGASIFGREDFCRIAGDETEPLFWMLGSDGRARYKVIGEDVGPRPLESRDFKDPGYYLLQSGETGSPEAISVLFDCGELGYGAIAAHGHADALSFTVRVGGEDLFVDPGTYDYFTFPEWRRYFRGTRAHNAVMVDGQDQSVMLGPFMWGARTRAECTKWEPRPEGGIVAGEHNGYERLADPVRHRRTLELEGKTSNLLVRDEIIAHGDHDVEIAFHLAETCQLEGIKGKQCILSLGNGNSAFLELDESLAIDVRSASSDPPGGWVSRGYHSKVPSITLVGKARTSGSTVFECFLRCCGRV